MMLAEHNTASHSVTGAERCAVSELVIIASSADIWNSLSWQGDMYSFGFIMSHILSGNIPYRALSNIQVIVAIMKGGKPPRLEDPQISERRWDFIQQCWLQFEGIFFRPSADDVCKFLQYVRVN
ncbi:hypothetical protein K503DRAFT_405084 [Rhizopogon vinicolor AM-OR11-026]|uniref:Serine-threonine/tyrosine-protein kinase catalytic domain-containing protein n=1 Tax=Rhizopogon vinicolor AM-OR11-026 TaxID=1314800 RepID=A0A1B7MQR5_9AGAM|nr:hypothetical protein K503DRAFT_405084 [Rhizopogon vinicolor AM-OR11-026]